MIEGKHQHILNVARYLIFQAKVPKVFWSYAIMHYVHLINHLPSPIIHNNCPYELLHNRIPGTSYMNVFGCLCFASTLERNKHKLDPRAQKCIFLGYKQGTKGYVVLDICTREIFV